MSGRDGERGTTLPDVMIGLALFGVITVAAMSTVLAIARSSAEVTSDLTLRQDVERAASMAAADVAGAEFVAADLPAGDYGNELHLVIDQATDERIVWSVRSGVLVREERSGGVVDSGVTLVESDASPAFEYLGADGGTIDPEVHGGSVVASCAGGVRILLSVTRGDDTATADVDAAIRARRPSIEGCP